MPFFTRILLPAALPDLLARLALLIALATVLPAEAGALPETVSKALAQAQIPESAVGIWVQGVDSDHPSLAHNAHTAMNPASVMKLVTAYAVLDALGSHYTWNTEVLSEGELRNGTLQGNLYLRGSGDPVLDFKRLWSLLRQVRASGIGHVTGDIVLDASALNLPGHDPHAFDGRGLRPYNSGPYGLLLHFNTLGLSLTPGTRAGEAVTLQPQQPLAGLKVDNRLVTSTGNCGAWWYTNLDASLQPGANGAPPELVISGNLPAACGRREWATAPLPPEAYASALVAGLWAELGGTLDGRVREGQATTAARRMLTDTSPALAEVVREMNKWSSNVIARQLLATLGRVHGGAGGMLDAVSAGAGVVKARMVEDGIDTRTLVIENGSGLSRIERIAPAALGHVLQVVWRSPYMPEFIAALPVAGQDGTARRRLQDSPARGQAHIKTGTINGVQAIGGYLLDRHGRRHVVVMMVNHPRAADSRTAQDALLEWVWSRPR